MKVIARYITKEFVSNFFLTVFVLTSLFLVIDFLGRVWEFLEKNIPTTIMLEYFLNKTPWVFFNMIPISCLLATLMTFSELSRKNEIIAMYAGGISIWKISRIIAAIGIVVTFFSFLVNEFIVPPSMAKAKFIQEVNVDGNSYQAFKKDKIWYRSKNYIYNLQFFEPNEAIIHGITIYEFNNSFRITRQIYAKSALWKNNNWILQEGTEIDLNQSKYPKMRHFKEELIYLPEKPKDLIVIEKSTDTVSFRELRRYVEKSKRAGLKSMTYEVDMHSKIALPFACFIMMFLALPFSIKHGRSGGIAVDIGYTFVFVLSYVFIQAISLSFGHNGKIEPILAAWAPNIIFIVVGLFSLRRLSS